MVISINELKNGLTIELNGAPYVIISADHIKPGKGAAFTRVKIKNLKTGAVLERTYRANDKIQEAYIDEKKLQFLYSQDDIFYFMDNDTFEEVHIEKDSFDGEEKFLKDNLDVSGYFYQEKLVKINLPNFIVFEIKTTEPGIKGDTAKSATKPAEIETGAIINVPLFINQGDKIKVDTRTASYIERSY
ncbi:MAG: elongation factor P [Candidatus Gygaella obscura]|nr:elongation factor P [Candidatus Gygaella obscura]